ncbi:TetR/AcrR family transcriptional regulator [Capillimicrobium parvum]|uniref:HTH tetR-type domain-containing protein n=1 Tax=Capillimicrobium parvum TaxID=2884022 RepID=A0A9E7C1D7_9ACTN|nr:TetR/AcrR family transcriptional regulator [Capillimicrobium parvum]UGS36477.1 hypothetical protein DSM104329_02883 [Capillimicrobium parvum]
MSIEAEIPRGGASLRRLPLQARSREKVQRILDAAAVLLIEIGYNAAVESPALLIARAEVTQGTFYTYFPNCEAAMEMLSLKQLDRAVAIVDDVAGAPHASWEDASDALLDAFAGFYADPVVRELWLNHHLTERALVLEDEANDYISGRTAELVERLSGGALRGDARRSRVATDIGDQLLRLAFRGDPAGDPALIEEARVAIRCYIASWDRPVGATGPGS